jgi:hypothetical protein
MRPLAFVLLLPLMLSCDNHKGPESNPDARGIGANLPSPQAYVPRIGVAVSTASRTCVSIHNANLAASSPITLVSPVLPQQFAQGQVGAVLNDACPVSKDPDAAATNYEVRLIQGSLPKLSPLIAVIGPAAPFSMGANNYVQADLEQNNKFESFRACSGTDGAHLTVWSGNPLDSSLLWHGFYYEPGNPGVGPVCTPKETVEP